MSSVHEEEENQFHRLPDDVVVNIFDKVSDIECLLRCFLVSKRFSSLVLRVQTVSVKGVTLEDASKSCESTERINPVGNGFLGKVSKFFVNNFVLKPFRYLLHNLAHLSPPPPVFQFIDSGLVCLPLFKHIRSLNLEVFSDFDFDFDFDFDADDSDSVFKWGADFTGKHHSVTFLYAKSLSKMTMEFQQEEDETEAENENQITAEELFRRVWLAMEYVKGAWRWLGILSLVVPKIPKLRNLTISDSMNKGVKLCFCGEKLVEGRNAFDLDEMVSMSENWTPQNMRVGYVPVLPLPVSGYVMIGVTILNFRISAADDAEAYSGMLDAFVEDQSVFSEAVAQILEKHKDGIKPLV